MVDTKVIILGIAALLGFALAAMLGKLIIPWLKKLKFGQTIREIGPSWHSGKEGTPTMGGSIFIISTVVTFIIAVIAIYFLRPSLLFSSSSSGEISGLGVAPVVRAKMFYGLIMSLACGALGFADDYIIAVKHRNLGLTSKQKLFGQICIAFIYALGIYLIGGTSVEVPFFGLVKMGVWFIPFCIFVVVAMTNAVNITDGIDGLCATTTFFASLFFVFVSYIGGFFGQSLIASILVGSLAGFLVWNLHPAKVFMGDTGSLFLGAMLVGIAFGINRPFLLVAIGIVYIIEILSVIIQVLYFKATKGKRLFKMSPIHHHFEMSGWSENKIVIVSSVITVIGGIIVFMFFL